VDVSKLPAEAGSYILVLEMRKAASLRSGPFLPLVFPSGLYVYCGSARGPGGIRARVTRHLAGGRAAHWHIDHLLARARPRAVWARTGCGRLECVWARAIAREGPFLAPAPRFGASDCRCPAHLWHIRARPEDLAAVLARLPSAPLPAWPDEDDG
jgi:Uri superfamily endonuclease